MNFLIMQMSELRRKELKIKKVVKKMQGFIFKRRIRLKVAKNTSFGKDILDFNNNIPLK